MIPAASMRAPAPSLALIAIFAASVTTAEHPTGVRRGNRAQIMGDPLNGQAIPNIDSFSHGNQSFGQGGYITN
jgi:hypothetical protein